MTDYSTHTVHARAYLNQAEQFLRDKEFDKGLAMLKLCDDEMRQAIAWVEEVLYPDAPPHHPV
jgi:hypothetical protein